MVILRLRTKEGMFRINAEVSDDFLLVLENLHGKIKTSDPQLIYISDKPNIKGEPANSLCGRTVEGLGLKNGDMLYVTYDQNTDAPTDKPSQPILATSVNGKQSVPMIPINVKDFEVPSGVGPMKVEQYPVDDLLEKEDGLIKRPMGHYCVHGPKGMCEYCSPLPPWDTNHRKENAIKHMSFQAHLKEINDLKNNRNNASSYIAPLDTPNYCIDLNCTNGHKPYPKGICSKCQPQPITLQLQKYRMVDHVEFADSSIMDRFIDSWRQTGIQRYGVLYGRYERFEKVPLGVKAVVEVIYEPPQAGEADGLTLLPWENEQQVDQLAKELGLYKVGVTFTDLTDSGNNDGSVLCKRHKDSYFLTNLEILMTARNQLLHRNPTKFEQSGYYSSKFVTCVISGGLEGEIEPRSYQVSLSAEALVKADIITASTQPSKLYINSSNDTRYVPDVQYLELNEYGLEVKTNAKPTFPVDFLLVSLSDSFPMDPKPMFSSTTNFTIENRDFMGELQDLHKVYQYLNNDTSGTGSQLFDFHFLVYLYKTGILGNEEFAMVLNFVKHHNYEDYLRLVESPGWMSLLTILEQSS
jgi:Nuclear pore protein